MTPAFVARHVVHHLALVLPKWSVLDRPWTCAVVVVGGKEKRGQEVEYRKHQLASFSSLAIPFVCVF